MNTKYEEYSKVRYQLIKEGFDMFQVEQIMLAYIQGINLKDYVPNLEKYDFKQMEQIIKAIESNVRVDALLNLEYNTRKMAEIRKFLQECPDPNFDPSKIQDKTEQVIYQLRRLIKLGIDYTEYLGIKDWRQIEMAIRFIGAGKKNLLFDDDGCFKNYENLLKEYYEHI